MVYFNNANKCKSSKTSFRNTILEIGPHSLHTAYFIIYFYNNDLIHLDKIYFKRQVRISYNTTIERIKSSN